MKTWPGEPCRQEPSVLFVGVGQKYFFTSNTFAGNKCSRPTRSIIRGRKTAGVLGKYFQGSKYTWGLMSDPLGTSTVSCWSVVRVFFLFITGEALQGSVSARKHTGHVSQTQQCRWVGVDAPPSWHMDVRGTSREAGEK